MATSQKLFGRFFSLRLPVNRNAQKLLLGFRFGVGLLARGGG
jgi:hypothetical protein